MRGLTSGALSGEGGLIPGVKNNQYSVVADIQTKQPLKISSKNYIPISNFFATDQESKQLQNNYYQDLEANENGLSQTPTVDQYLYSGNNDRGGNRPKKVIQVFVESNIEFNIDISDPKCTCGWLQSEVVRKYYEVLEKQAFEQQ